LKAKAFATPPVIGECLNQLTNHSAANKRGEGRGHLPARRR